MFLCLGRRSSKALGSCNTITACSFQERVKSRQDIPEGPSPVAAGTLSAVTKEVCGTGDKAAGLWEGDARNGLPEDMVEANSNALFYVHGRSSVRGGVERSIHCALPRRADVVGALGDRRRRALLGTIRRDSRDSAASAPTMPPRAELR
jgi:hypothetical protein